MSSRRVAANDAAAGRARRELAGYGPPARASLSAHVASISPIRFKCPGCPKRTAWHCCSHAARAEPVYLGQPRTIILAVIKAPDDIATSDIVERATVVDPDGERTVGVLTMPDLVNPGAEDTVLGVLSNKTKPLKNGYFMQVNQLRVPTVCDRRGYALLVTNAHPPVALQAEEFVAGGAQRRYSYTSCQPGEGDAVF